MGKTPCPACTFLNSSGRSTCDLCSNPLCWACEKCTFLNGAVSQLCEVCGSPSPARAACALTDPGTGAQPGASGRGGGPFFLEPLSRLPFTIPPVHVVCSPRTREEIVPELRGLGLRDSLIVDALGSHTVLFRPEHFQNCRRGPLWAISKHLCDTWAHTMCYHRYRCQFRKVSQGDTGHLLPRFFLLLTQVYFSLRDFIDQEINHEKLPYIVICTHVHFDHTGGAHWFSEAEEVEP